MSRKMQLVATAATLLLADAFFSSAPLPIRPRVAAASRVPPRRAATVDASVASSAAGAVGSANLDWPALGFEYRPTAAFARCVFKDGAWGPLELADGASPTIELHVGATVLHYGQTCFEGLKAFAWADGSVRLFRPDENAKRMARSAARMVMPVPPAADFIAACAAVVRANLPYVPPHGSGGALYLRPLLIGSGPRIGLQPAEEYTFLVMCTPVGDYYQGGLKPVPALVIEDFDRAAPRGVGDCKVGGNYAADLLPNTIGKAQGFPIGLYLDAAEHKYVEEFSTSNFIGVKPPGPGGGKGTFVTPQSPAVLASITNLALLALAEDEGLAVERRPIPYEEVAAGGFDEVAACGTAVVLTPVSSIVREGVATAIGAGPDAVGPVCRRLYDRLRNIQTGDDADAFGWTVDIAGVAPPAGL